MNYKKDKNLDLIIRNNVFYGNNLLYFIYKKGIKISKAVYLITDIIKDIEPVKWSLRETAIGLAVLKDNQDIKKTAQTIGSKVANIKTLVMLANFSRNISDMNTEVLVKECDDLLVSISEIDTFSGEYLALEKNFFEVELGQTPSPFLSTLTQEKNNDEPSFYKGHIKDKESTVSFMQTSNERGNPITSSKVLNLKDTLKPDRTIQIIDIIRNKGEVTIKDISSLIKDCSEKTIQRELIGLLTLGQIKKTGDRRWSRYSLK